MNRGSKVVRRGMPVFLKQPVINGSGEIPAGTKAAVVNYKHDTVNLEVVLAGASHRFRTSVESVSPRPLRVSA